MNRGRMFYDWEQQTELLIMKPTKHKTEVSNAYCGDMLSPLDSDC
jgi:hypothetical protein